MNTKLSEIAKKLEALFASEDRSLQAIADTLGIRKEIIFRGTTLVPEQVENYDLRGYDLTGSTLKGFDFSKYRLFGANLKDCSFENCDFSKKSDVEFSHNLTGEISYIFGNENLNTIFKRATKILSSIDIIHPRVHNYRNELVDKLIKYDEISTVIDRLTFEERPVDQNEKLEEPLLLISALELIRDQVFRVDQEKITLRFDARVFFESDIIDLFNHLLDICNNRIPRRSWGKISTKTRSITGLYLEYSIHLNIVDSYVFSKPYLSYRSAAVENSIERMFEISESCFDNILLAKSKFMQFMVSSHNSKAKFYSDLFGHFDSTMSASERHIFVEWLQFMFVYSRSCRRIVGRNAYLRSLLVLGGEEIFIRANTDLSRLQRALRRK